MYQQYKRQTDFYVKKVKSEFQGHYIDETHYSTSLTNLIYEQIETCLTFHPNSYQIHRSVGSDVSQNFIDLSF